MMGIQVWLGIGAGVLSSGNGDLLTQTQGLAVIGAVFFAAGLGVVYFHGRGPLRRTRQYLRSDPWEPTAAVGDGPVTARGTIEPVNRSLSAPVTGDECVAYESVHQVFKDDWRYDYDRRRQMKRSSMHTEEEAEERIITWHTESTDEDAVPFVLETASGSVAVYPEGADLDLPKQAVEQSSWIRRALHRVTAIASVGRLLGTSPERLIERHVKPGDTVLVVGGVDEADAPVDGPSDVDGRIGDETDPFVISTRSKRSLAARSLVKTIGASIPGVVFLAIGTIFVLGSLASAGFL